MKLGVMWGHQDLLVIHLNSFFRGTHLLPIFNGDWFLPCGFHQSYTLGCFTHVLSTNKLIFFLIRCFLNLTLLKMSCCKPVLTTISISATFPDSCHILVYVYVHLMLWLHRPSWNPFFSRALSSVSSLTTSYPLLFLYQYTLVLFPSWSDPVFPIQDTACLHFF